MNSNKKRNSCRNDKKEEIENKGMQFDAFVALVILLYESLHVWTLMKHLK